MSCLRLLYHPLLSVCPIAQGTFVSVSQILSVWRDSLGCWTYQLFLWNALICIFLKFMSGKISLSGEICQYCRGILGKSKTAWSFYIWTYCISEVFYLNLTAPDFLSVHTIGFVISLSPKGYWLIWLHDSLLVAIPFDLNYYCVALDLNRNWHSNYIYPARLRERAKDQTTIWFCL